MNLRAKAQCKIKGSEKYIDSDSTQSYFRFEMLNNITICNLISFFKLSVFVARLLGRSIIPMGNPSLVKIRTKRPVEDLSSLTTFLTGNI
jgi:hypothetical protein